MSFFDIFSGSSSIIDKITGKFKSKLSSCTTWDELVSVISEFEEEIKNIEVKHAQKYFAEKMYSNKAGVIQKLYYKENGKFYEQTTECEIDFDSLPGKLKRQLTNLHEEIDISDIVNKELNIRSTVSSELDSEFTDTNKSSAIDEIISKYNHQLTLCNDWNKLMTLMHDFDNELSNVKFSRKFFVKVTSTKQAIISMKLYVKSTTDKVYEYTSNSKIDYDNLPANVQSKIKDFSNEFDITEVVDQGILNLPYQEKLELDI